MINAYMYTHCNCANKFWLTNIVSTYLRHSHNGMMTDLWWNTGHAPYSNYIHCHSSHKLVFRCVFRCFHNIHLHGLGTFHTYSLLQIIVNKTFKRMKPSSYTLFASFCVFPNIRRSASNNLLLLLFISLSIVTVFWYSPFLSSRCKCTMNNTYEVHYVENMLILCDIPDCYTWKN